VHQGTDQGSARARLAALGATVLVAASIDVEATTRGVEIVDMKLEVVLLPVSDVDRAKAFYKGWGCREDADFVINDGFRIVQVTPPGSECSIIFGQGLTSAEPGSVQGLQLTVVDIQAARAELVDQGLEVSELFHDAQGAFHHAGIECRVLGADSEQRDYFTFASFSDPDGNGFLLQQVKQRAPGR
jgi:catechol 2,3-dioxygenase-like lactoylglutathione lyase family enzyme